MAYNDDDKEDLFFGEAVLSFSDNGKQAYCLHYFDSLGKDASGCYAKTFHPPQKKGKKFLGSKM